MDKTNKIAAAIAFLVLLIVAGGLLFFETKKDKPESFELIQSSSHTYDIAVVYINAGKADSILVMAAGKSYLIDTGESDSAAIIQQVLMKYGIEGLDGVFLTHSHNDHIGGLKKLSKVYPIENLYSTGYTIKDENGENPIEKKAGKSDLTLRKLFSGDRVDIAEGLCFEVIAPMHYNEADDNDNSLVLRLFANGKTFLFCGDMQFAEEQSLLDAGFDLSADVLKVGNHGNPDATSEQFAEAVSPEIAVITTDTSVDTDSANPRVKKLFSNVYLTQDYRYGIKITVDKDGNLELDEG